MSDNPYRFTVTTRKSAIEGWWVEISPPRQVKVATEAEANKHAELIRQAMREVS